MTLTSQINEGNTTTPSLPLRDFNYSDPQIKLSKSTIIPKSDDRLSHSIDPIYKKKVVCIETQPQILDKVVLDCRIPCRTKFFLECLCNDKLNREHIYDGMFKMLIQDINESPQLQEDIEKELCRRFPENHEEGIRCFFTTYHNDDNAMQSLAYLHASNDIYHRFFSPLDFIKGILDNIYSGRPMITSVEGSTLQIEYKPIKKSEMNTDWKEIDDNPDYARGSIVSVSKELLSSPTAHIETKEDLDRWFVMIKRALPVRKTKSGCYQRCAFAESLLSVMGLETRIITIYPEKGAPRIKFNPDSKYQLDESWKKHRICAVKLSGSDELYTLDFPYEETIPLSMHPNLYGGNQWEVCDPDQDPVPKSRYVSHGYSIIMYLQGEWRAEQYSDSQNYAPDKPQNGYYYYYMTWDKQSRQWQRIESNL